jgi:signal transduction histidine kinase
MPKLFKISNPFTTPGTANEIGSGLGLILSKELIQKNGGELSFKSKYKGGSSFTFALPKIAI